MKKLTLTVAILVLIAVILGGCNTSDKVGEATKAQICKEGQKCMNALNSAYQTIDCKWNNITYCKDGCINSTGRCRILNTTQPILCADTDGGFNIVVRGSILNQRNNNATLATDTCSASSAGSSAVLVEYTCQNNSIGYGSSVANCQYGCTNGACRTAPTNTTQPVNQTIPRNQTQPTNTTQPGNQTRTNSTR